MSKSPTGEVIDLVERGMRLHPCPGYKRACGVSTPRPLCYFCTKAKGLEAQ